MDPWAEARDSLAEAARELDSLVDVLQLLTKREYLDLVAVQGDDDDDDDDDYDDEDADAKAQRDVVLRLSAKREQLAAAAHQLATTRAKLAERLSMERYFYLDLSQVSAPKQEMGGGGEKKKKEKLKTAVHIDE